MATLEIVEPTDKDKGMYTFEIVDPEKTHSRILDLSGERELYKQTYRLYSTKLRLKFALNLFG